MAPTLVLSVWPHLISAATIAAGLLDRAMSEPLAHGRDEVLYLICTHPRVVVGQVVDRDGWSRVYRAEGPIGGPFTYDMEKPWARIRLPAGVRISALGWALLDPLLEDAEGLVPDASFDPSRDPEGVDGRHRQELLPWIFDRCFETSSDNEPCRGEVRDAKIEFRVEYIGKAGRDALRRASGPHHKMPLILQRTLLYSPDRLVYVLPCDIRAARYEPDLADTSVPVLPLDEAVQQTRVPRHVLISAAEEALIATLGAPYNERNTAVRRFPSSDAGSRLREMGFAEMILGFFGLPERVTVRGQLASVSRSSQAVRFPVTSG
jgi:hypothetical protein